ncbi:MAG: thiamine pyrophosphate-dependent enzyme [Anaerolineales bacterium]|jgi:2-oxoglutarate ferredoxin oxidoreductase subunit beta
MSLAEITNYLDEDSLPYPFCPGCGHGAILDDLNEALVKLQVAPQKLVIVTDIGCSGLSDKHFKTNAFHGLHGRSVTYATGMKLANPDLKVVVLMGDGGCGIGGHHLINAARRNIGVTVLVFNNLNYGMTGGEHSVSTPPGAITATTKYGHLEQPMDICATASVNGAGFVARATAFDKGLPDLIAQAMQQDGFALIDIWELCTAYYVPNNKFSKRALEETLANLNFTTGILQHSARREYSRAYRAAVADQKGLPTLEARTIQSKYTSTLTSAMNLVIAGKAGMKIITAATLFSRGALLSGLWASQRSDYPVTVKSGYSLSEVNLSPNEIPFTGVPKPDLMLVLAPEALSKVGAKISALGESDRLYIDADLMPVDTRARIIPLHFDRTRLKRHWAITALAALLQHASIYPLEAFREAVSKDEAYARENLVAVEASEGLIADSS